MTLELLMRVGTVIIVSAVVFGWTARLVAFIWDLLRKLAKAKP